MRNTLPDPQRKSQGSASGQIIGSLLVIAAAAGVIFLLLATQPEPQARLQDVVPLRVVVAEVQRENLAPVEEVTGRLQPAREASLRFEVSGRVHQRLVEPGMFVTRGQVLATLEESDLRALLVEADARLSMEEAGVGRDEELLAFARRNRRLQSAEVKRLEKLGKQSLSSRSQLDAARQRMVQLAAEESQLKYAVGTAATRIQLRQSEQARAQRNLGRSRLTASFDGIVNEVHVQVGNTVNSTQKAVSLIDTARLDLRLQVRGAAVAGLALGQRIAVQVGNVEHEGEIVALQTDPEPSTNTHALHIRLNGEHARAGTLATALLPLPAHDDALTVPATAVQNVNGESFVFRYGNGQLQRLDVTSGPKVGERRVVEKGLSAGDRIVARDVASLGDGQKVIAIDDPAQSE